MFFYGFFKNMPHKQYLAEIFLIAILCVVFTQQFSGWKGKLLIFLFGVGSVTTPRPRCISRSLRCWPWACIS
jgi:uncharacterized membrane protein